MDIEYIEKTLNQLQDIYDLQDEIDNPFISKELLCKIAHIELCGWLEDVFDDLIKNCKNNILNSIQHHDKNVKDKFNPWSTAVDKEISNIYGVSYTNHFKKLLIKLLGDFMVLKIEYQIGFDKIEIFNNTLEVMHKDRNILAHQSSYNIFQQKTIDSPNKILLNFRQNISPILGEFKRYLEEIIL